METGEIIGRLTANRAAIVSRGVRHLALFGSRARGVARPDSDLDILVDVPSGSRFSLLDLIGIEHLVSDITGIEARAVVSRSLDAEFRKNIQPDIVEVF